MNERLDHTSMVLLSSSTSVPLCLPGLPPISYRMLFRISSSEVECSAELFLLSKTGRVNEFLFQTPWIKLYVNDSLKNLHTLIRLMVNSPLTAWQELGWINGMDGLGTILKRMKRKRRPSNVSKRTSSS